jgi:hypothetical protein
MNQPSHRITTLLAPSANGIGIAAIRSFVICVAIFVYAALARDWITNAQGLVAYSTILIAHLSAEAYRLKKLDPHLFLLNPVILASLFTFALSFGLGNVLFFMPEDIVATVGLEPVVTPWMN